MKLFFILIISAIIGIHGILGNPAPRNPAHKTSSIKPRKFLTTADRIRNYGYPVEEHTVQTKDAYILQLFRIPYSKKLNNAHLYRPVIFLQHGLLSSSDSWILNGPLDALAFLLADAGYDVWMGNARGNTYSRKNSGTSPINPSFWDFSWHEIATIDLPAMIDYVLYRTDEESLHYVGHSQGTTTFMVLLSQLPRYNNKFKSTHMLAPVAYMENMESPLAKVVGPLLGFPSMIGDLLGNGEFLPHSSLLALLGSEACKDKSIFQPMCTNILFLIAGWDSQHLNTTLLPEVVQTHPAGSSTKQVLHYLQEYNSGHFRQYDHGLILNKKYYKQNHPPDYLIENIRPEVPIVFYYSDNDYMAAVVDVHRMMKQLGKHVVGYHIPYPDWNHLDFLWAINVNSIINQRVIKGANSYEQKKKRRHSFKF